MSAPAAYVVPEDPADPEAAAYELIVRFPTEILAEPGRLLHPLIEVLQDYTGMLSARDAMAGLVWADAKQIAVAIAFDLCQRDDPGGFLRLRARNAESGADNMAWHNRARAARAMQIAAEVADL